MIERREHNRHEADITLEYEYYTAMGDENYSTAFKPERASARILNISLGGLFMLSDVLLRASMPVAMFFKRRDEHDRENIVLITNGTVLRAGHVGDDSVIKERYGIEDNEESYYSVVKFYSPLIELSALMR